MKTFETMEDILNYAILQEEEAFEFYSDLARKAASMELKNTFAAFAQEELGHKQKLRDILTGKPVQLAFGKIPSLGIADYVAKAPVFPDMSYQIALITAMRREKAAYKLYMDLSILVEESALKDTFSALAREEANHKLRFELEYDDHILIEN